MLIQHRWIMLCLVPIILSSCAVVHNYRAYDGAARPGSEVAVLHAPKRVFIRRLDGRDDFVPFFTGDMSYGGVDVELLPGTHVVSLVYADAKGDVSESRDIRFEALAGRRYAVTYGYGGEFMRFWVTPIDER